jgi:hypothetical protein
MGLLDDAIREHLELKRQHGADPTEVARQEREALGSGRVPPQPATEDAASSDALPDAPPTTADAAPPAHEPPFPDAIPEPPVEDAPRREPGGAVSIGRAAELDEEDDVAWSDPPPLDDPEPPPPAPGAASDDVLEETPEFLQETPEHERLWFEQRPPKDFDF